MQAKASIKLLFLVAVSLAAFLWYLYSLTNQATNSAHDRAQQELKRQEELKNLIDTSDDETDTPMIACTQEARLCPDGKTYVGRTGPKCEFASCP